MKTALTAVVATGTKKLSKIIPDVKIFIDAV
jgi:hypothetical protein